MLRILLGTIILLASGECCLAQRPGDVPSGEVQAKVRQKQRSLAVSMNERDMEGVHAKVKAIRSLLGPYAGVPESPEFYAKSIDISQPNREALEAAWQSTFENMLPLQGAYSLLAKENKLELRESAYIALACLAAAESDPIHQQPLVKRATDELDYLLDRQAANGLFPYPVDPGGRAPANVRAMADKARKERPEAVRNGYLYLDIPDMQFDVSCCGVAMCAGYGSTGQAVYLESARKAGQWAITIPMSPNWNYNAFSVWLLANLYKVSGEKEYLDAALEKVRFGVLPGLMENGRWVDQHNAKQSYHFIMVRAISDLVAVMARGSSFEEGNCCQADSCSRIASHRHCQRWRFQYCQRTMGSCDLCS